MTMQISGARDSVAAGLTANGGARESAGAAGRYVLECFDKDGNLKWVAETGNLVVNTGLQYLAGAALTGTTPVTTWYLGLYGASAANNPAAGDTMASHAGWTEVTAYTEATRPVATFAAATLASPSVVTNTANKAMFTMNATTTVGGAFLTSSNTKGGTTGTLFSAADFQAPGDRVVATDDVLNLTYTFSQTAL